MASNGFKKLMLGMEELGHELSQGDEYFNLLYSYISKEDLDEYRNEPITESAESIQYGVHQFSTDSIIFRGSEEECGKYIDERPELWDDAEVYMMTPDDQHYLKEAFYDANKSYVAKECSYDIAKEIAQKAKNALKLPTHEVEMLEHDINNLRSAEWLESFANLSDRSEAKKLFFTYAVKEVDDLDEAISDEKIELKYKDLKFIQTGPMRDADDWDEYEVCADWIYEVDKEDVYNFIFESCLQEEDFPAAFSDDFDPNNAEDWKQFTDWLDDNFDVIFNKYNEQILKNWQYDAEEEASCDYVEDDYWGQEDDYSLDESVKNMKASFKPIYAALEDYAMEHPDYFRTRDLYDAIDNLSHEGLIEIPAEYCEDHENCTEEEAEKFIIDFINSLSAMDKLKLTYIKLDECDDILTEKAEKYAVTCCICHEPIINGYGNNAQPVMDGTCCDKCNIERVIPMRFEMMKDNEVSKAEGLQEEKNSEKLFRKFPQLRKTADVEVSVEDKWTDLFKKNEGFEDDQIKGQMTIDDLEAQPISIPAPYDKVFELFSFDDDSMLDMIGRKIKNIKILSYVQAKEDYQPIFDSLYYLTDDDAHPIVEIDANNNMQPVDISNISLEEDVEIACEALTESLSTAQSEKFDDDMTFDVEECANNRLMDNLFKGESTLAMTWDDEI